MHIIEITAKNDFGYHDFFVQGLSRHGDCFKMNPDEQKPDSFPTSENPYSFTIAALDASEKLMGVVSFQRLVENRKKLQHKGQIFKMYVSNENGRKNIGTTLLKYVIERVKNDLPDIEQINLNVATKNEKAKQLYQKLGFEHFGTERNAFKFNDIYYDDDYMVLDLKLHA
ncbi:GNAT family N-acetyltransferase [Dyadobacter sp. NIV53]|uniref:GNAT family N-acetyltransferase n=1 Tax=Dyadobacter sp. NIV53 TaxID=2861765 RepID=UPI001C8689A3|nr:GNAT family N-acetyltransferase [Dyadobacter sp. NIV53]